MYSEWQRCGTPMVRALLAGSHPCAAAAAAVQGRSARAGLRDLARTAMLPVHRFTAERFTAPPPRC